MATSKKRAQNAAPQHRGRYRRGSTTVTEEARKKFLATLMEGWSPLRAAQVAGHPRTTFYNLREDNEQFKIAWDAAIEAGSDLLEDTAKKRSIDGWLEPVFYQGEQCGTVRKFSDTLLMFQLNGRRPEKYRQNVKVDAPGLAQAFAAGMMQAMNKHGQRKTG